MVNQVPPSDLKYESKTGPRAIALPKRIEVFLLFLLILWLAPGPAWADPPLFYINSATVEPYTTEDGKGFLNLTVAEIFRRVGAVGKINRYNGASARSLKMSNSGVDDGEATRIPGLEKKFPNLVRVPESITKFEFLGYSTRPLSPITKWEDLKSHSVAYMIGWQIFTQNTTGVKNIVTTSSAKQLFSMLKLDRVDVILYDRWQGLWLTRKLGMRVNIHEPPLATMKTYMYLHKKHQDWVPKVAKALAMMKKDGTYRRIFDKTLAPLLSR